MMKLRILAPWQRKVELEFLQHQTEDNEMKNQALLVWKLPGHMLTFEYGLSNDYLSNPVREKLYFGWDYPIKVRPQWKFQLSASLSYFPIFIFSQVILTSIPWVVSLNVKVYDKMKETCPLNPVILNILNAFGWIISIYFFVVIISKACLSSFSLKYNWHITLCYMV